MSCNATVMLTCSALLLISSLTHAGDRHSPKAAAYECARAIYDQVGVGAYEVIRMTHPGRDRYRIWMNAHDESVGAFCTTRRGDVVETFVDDSPWAGRHPARPQMLASNPRCGDTRGR